MADVGRSTDRGQLLLLAALGMAILFVALALVLNTVIYTENLATRGSEIAGGGESLRYLDTARTGLGHSIEYVNDNNATSHDALVGNLSATVPVWANASRRQLFHRSRSVNVSLVGTTNGTHIDQDAERNFTNESGTANWTLASDVTGTREYAIEVNSTTELESFPASSAFNVTVDDGSTQWRLNVTENGSSIVVGVRDGNGNEATCSAPSAPVWINVTAGTVDGEECDGLTFREGVSTPYEISYFNGHNVTGTYSVIVDNESVATSPGPHLLDDGAGNPHATPAIYSGRISVVYHAPRLFYDAEARAAPGERE